MTHAPDRQRDFAERYTVAWCGQDPVRVAAFFSPNGSLRINDGVPAVGRGAITEAARGFMTAFPDLEVRMEGLRAEGENVVYSWLLTGSNTGPGGKGHRVRVRGFEEWRFGADGRIAESRGHFDAADYQRQIEHGLKSPRFFDEEDVRARLRMPDLVEAMERAVVEFSAGRVQQPVRTVLAFGAERSVFGLMPSYVPSLPTLGAKLVTVCAGNRERGLGTHQAIIVMLDPVTGEPDAILDGRYIT